MLLPLIISMALASAQQPPQPAPAENTTCPVMGQKVNEKSRTAVVKGRTYRICCIPCGPKLEKDPDKYLNPDGTPKNQKK